MSDTNQTRQMCERQGICLACYQLHCTAPGGKDACKDATKGCERVCAKSEKQVLTSSLYCSQCNWPQRTWNPAGKPDWYWKRLPCEHCGAQPTKHKGRLMPVLECDQCCPKHKRKVAAAQDAKRQAYAAYGGCTTECGLVTCARSYELVTPGFFPDDTDDTLNRVWRPCLKQLFRGYTAMLLKPEPSRRDNPIAWLKYQVATLYKKYDYPTRAEEEQYEESVRQHRLDANQPERLELLRCLAYISDEWLWLLRPVSKAYNERLTDWIRSNPNAFQTHILRLGVDPAAELAELRKRIRQPDETVKGQTMNTTDNAHAAALLAAQQQQVMASLRQLCQSSKGQKVSQSVAMQVHLALLGHIEVARLVLNGEYTYAELAAPHFDVHFIDPQPEDTAVTTPDFAERACAAAHAIAVERADKQARQRAAFKSGDLGTVLQLAWELCGGEGSYEAGDRTNSRVN